MNRYVKAILLLLTAALCVIGPARAQEPGGLSDAELGEAAEAVRELRSVSPKAVIFVFDVSGSMRGQNLRRAREATINLLREGTAIGDRAVLMTFGSGYRTVFDRTIQSEADRRALIEKVPSDVEEGRGTNIRKPHHDALKILDANLPRPGAVILLTDSLNDQPGQDDPAYAQYIRYYIPGARLDRYPDTPENRDYERLLKKVQRSQKVRIYGIGVQIDSNGRPVERAPKAAPEVPETPVAESSEPAETTTPAPGIPWPWIAAGLAALLLLLLALLPRFRSTPLRIKGGPAGAKDFQVKHNGTVRLGGDGANFAFDAYPLPGVSEAPAVIRGDRGLFRLSPAPTPATPEASLPKVFHNGLPLEQTVNLDFGDEVRISVPEPAGNGREFRLKFEDPRKSY